MFLLGLVGGIMVSALLRPVRVVREMRECRKVCLSRVMPEQQNIPRTRVLTEDGSEHVRERLSQIAIVLENARKRGTVAGDALEHADVALQARGFGGGQARRARRLRGRGIGPIAGGG